MKHHLMILMTFKLGVKWQLDVKYVPFHCALYPIPHDMKFYQYTVVDEATRQRFIYAYTEQTAMATVNFIERAVKFFGYVPKMIQTDNGSEFTYTRPTKPSTIHKFNEFCEENIITDKCTKPRTPRYNGKVERSHRNDSERFYRYLRFKTFKELQEKMSAYLIRSNNIPMSVLNSRDNTKCFLSPNQKRTELLYLDYSIIEHGSEKHLRFLNLI